MVGILIPILIIGATVAISWPLGKYMRWAMDPAQITAGRSRFEKFGNLVLGKCASEAQNWKAYCVSMLSFNALMFAFVFTVLSLQHLLPLNPDIKEGLEAGLAFNTAASFTSNTNLQHYSGEVSMSYFSQLFALMWLQFVSAATGIAAVTAMCRGLAGRAELGNFFQDVWRATGLILLPMSLLSGRFQRSVYLCEEMFDAGHKSSTRNSMVREVV